MYDIYKHTYNNLSRYFIINKELYMNIDYLNVYIYILVSLF